MTSMAGVVRGCGTRQAGGHPHGPGRRGWPKLRITARGCWEWTGKQSVAGYGEVYGSAGSVYAHRLAWALRCGDPAEASVLHSCDNPPCCNPAHLFLGDQGANMRDMATKGRQRNQNAGKMRCLRGHEFAGDNLRIAPNGDRVCRECRRLRQRKAA